MKYDRQLQPLKTSRREFEDADKPEMNFNPEAWKDRLKKFDAFRELVALCPGKQEFVCYLKDLA